MNISPDITQATWELGSAVFSVLNIRAVRRSKSIAGVHWAPTAYFFGWGLYNLWFYQALHLPLAWWGGMAITATNLIWLAHVGWYALPRWPSLTDPLGQRELSIFEAADAFIAELRRRRGN